MVNYVLLSSVMIDPKDSYSFLTKEIVGQTPRWIIRWGVTIILTLFVVLGLVLSLIKYPVSFDAMGSMEYKSGPIPLTAPGNCIVADTYSFQHREVKKGTTIMSLQSVDTKDQHLVTAPLSGNL